jgi:hypothetical protein
MLTAGLRGELALCRTTGVGGRTSRAPCIMGLESVQVLTAAAIPAVVKSSSVSCVGEWGDSQRL